MKDVRGGRTKEGGKGKKERRGEQRRVRQGAGSGLGQLPQGQFLGRNPSASPAR